MNGVQTLLDALLQIGVSVVLAVVFLCVLYGAWLIGRAAGSYRGDDELPPPLDDEGLRARVWREYLQLPARERQRVLAVARLVQTIAAGIEEDTSEEARHGCD